MRDLLSDLNNKRYMRQIW